MLMTIVLLFALCWAPWHAFHLVRAYRQDWLLTFTEYDAGSPRYLFIVITTHWLSMANSCVNPIIYCFMSDNFRVCLCVFFIVYRRILSLSRRLNLTFLLVFVLFFRDLG